jgi:cytochrome c
MRNAIGVAALCAALLATVAALAYLPKEVEHGQKLFTDHCAVCHGSDARGGQVPPQFAGYAGMKAPALVGRGALPHMANAENIYAFIHDHMPLHHPGTLSDQDYLDIVTYVVNANNIAKPGTQPMAPEALRSIKMPKM